MNALCVDQTYLHIAMEVDGKAFPTFNIVPIGVATVAIGGTTCEHEAIPYSVSHASLVPQVPYLYLYEILRIPWNVFQRVWNIALIQVPDRPIGGAMEMLNHRFYH